jgi:4-amino-4-deoxy-L-arabinose transferase-like glycosyltransferase
MLQVDRQHSVPWKWLFGAIGLLGLFLLGLGRSLLFDVDEGAFTEATREMLVSGDWGHTSLNGVDRFDKPIGIYWLQALSTSLFGITEFAFRLPSALSAWIASLALSRFAFVQWGGRAAIIAGIISATSLGPWAMARTATADALLGLVFVLIFLDLWRALSAQSSWPGRRVALWIALGMLVKGPVSLILPTGTLILYFVLVPAARITIQKLACDAVSWLILISVSLPWYVYAYLRHGQAFIDGFILKHNVERFMGSMEGHSGHWSYFVIALPLLWLPWSGLMVRALLQIRMQWDQGFLKFCWAWFAFVFCFFTLANTKLPHYLLYAGPAVCMLLTYAFLDARKSWLLTVVLGLSGFALMLLLPEQLQLHPAWISDVHYKVLLETSDKTDMKVWLFAVPLLYVLGSGLHYFFRGSVFVKGFNAIELAFICFAVFQSLVFALVVLPWWSHALQSPVHDLAKRHQADSGTIVQWGVHVPSFATYRLQEAPRRAPQAGEMALVKNDKPFWPADWQVMDVSGPFSIVKSPD